MICTTARDDRQAAERYRLLLYGAIARRIPSDSLLAALLDGLAGTPYQASTDYRALWNRLSRESFVQQDRAGGLVYHEVIRAGFLAHLQSAERQRWRDLHGRAAAWWRAEPDEAEALYHVVQADYDAAIGELRDRVQAALAAQDWPLAQAIIDTTTELPVQPDDQAWITLFKAELAWGEGNRPLMMRRLARLLMMDDLPEELAERLAVDLASWFGFHSEMAWEQVKDLDGQTVELLFWWARQRATLQVQAHALLGLGQAARMQARYADARLSFEQAFDIYLTIGTAQDALRIALISANAALDQAQGHREQERSQRLILQALSLARWLLDWAERAAARADPAISAQYNLHIQALRARLASQ